MVNVSHNKAAYCTISFWLSVGWIPPLIGFIIYMNIHDSAVIGAIMSPVLTFLGSRLVSVSPKPAPEVAPSSPTQGP